MNSVRDSFPDRERVLADALDVAVPESVRAQLDVVLRTVPDAKFTRADSKLRLRLAFLIGVLVAGGVTAALWFGQRDGRADDVYAAVIKALDGVDTMHLTGWTTDTNQRWQSSREENLDDGTRYPVETWEWATDEGVSRSHSTQGPIVIVVDGDRRYEYDTRYDHLAITERQPAEIRGPRLREFFEQIETIKDRSVLLRDLGEKTDAKGRRLCGIAWDEGDGKQGEVWFDAATNLPVIIDEFDVKNGAKRQRIHGEFEFDVPVPGDVLAYKMPEAERVSYDSRIDPRFELWHLHLKELAKRIRSESVPDGMMLIPRESNRKFEAYYPGRLPGITQETGLWVRPVQEPLKSFVESNWSPRGSMSVADELSEFQINHDLLTSNDYSDNERVRFVVNVLGLQLVERLNDETVWVARYDGRKLKPWQEVKAPVPNPDNVPLRPGMAAVWGEISMAGLLEKFASGTNAIVLDETGLSDNGGTSVAAEWPIWFDSEYSDRIAKRWFEEEFGVTFTEEMREQRTYEVKRP